MQATKEQLIKWADALPNYQQCYGRLIRELPEGNKSYCCLGVYLKVNGYAISSGEKPYRILIRDLERFNVNTFVHANDEQKLPFIAIAEKIREMYDL